MHTNINDNLNNNKNIFYNNNNIHSEYNSCSDRNKILEICVQG